MYCLDGMINMDTQNSFTLEEPAFFRFFRKIKGILFSFIRRVTKSKTIENIYWKYFHGFHAANEEVTLPLVKKSLEKAAEIGTTEIGDYYEFGIFNGYTFLYAQKIAQYLNLGKIKFFGFDSFKGLPKIKGRDKTEYYAYYRGELSYSKERVIKNLDSRGVNWDKTFLVKGFFENSLNEETRKKYRMDKISVALIDCDLYSSAVEVLNFIKDMIIDKTILIFDEYDSIIFRGDKEKGERRAFEEFLEKNKNLTAEYFISIGTGRAFIIHKK